MTTITVTRLELGIAVSPSLTEKHAETRHPCVTPNLSQSTLIGPRLQFPLDAHIREQVKDSA